MKTLRKERLNTQIEWDCSVSSPGQHAAHFQLLRKILLIEFG